MNYAQSLLLFKTNINKIDLRVMSRLFVRENHLTVQLNNETRCLTLQIVTTVLEYATVKEYVQTW